MKFLASPSVTPDGSCVILGCETEICGDNECDINICSNVTCTIKMCHAFCDCNGRVLQSHPGDLSLF